MKISLAIKNAILILLILLIAHFLIKNFLISSIKSSENVNNQNFINTDKKEISKSTMIDKNEPYPFYHKIPITICDDKNKKDIELENVNKNELLQYVFSDDDKSLNKYYEDDAVSKEVKDLENSISTNNECKTLDNNHIPLSTTCDGSMEYIDFADNEKQNKKVMKNIDVLEKLNYFK